LLAVLAYETGSPVAVGDAVSPREGEGSVEGVVEAGGTPHRMP
jgi:hypothetical protein